MKFDLDALRRISETRKPLVEEERRREKAFWKAKAESDRVAAEEALFQRIIAPLDLEVKWAAERGERYATLEQWTPMALGFVERWWYSYPERISKRHLPSVWQRVYDYCKKQGFKVRIELSRPPRQQTVYKFKVCW